MKTWKRREAQVARFFGTERTPLSGGNGGQTRADTLHPTLFFEQKHRKAHSILRVWDKARALARTEGKTPVVTISEANRSGFWLLVHCDDLQTIIEEVQK